MNFTDVVSAKNVGKIFVDFETLTLKFKPNVYLFLQGLNYRVLSLPGKKFDQQLLSVSALFSPHTLFVMFLTSREILVLSIFY